MTQNLSIWEKVVRHGDMLFSISLLGIIFVLVLPLPTILLDGLLSISIALSVLIILTIAYIKDPTEFSIFPTILLFVTLFRLGLNIATTRSILANGDAGNLIDAFGQFVVQGNVVIGIIVFIILTIINFIVITKGAGRVAEVSARFTLDAMPGKQMSIDADLNSGIISEQEARSRRRAIEKEASFYGAMDGASKFVRGDAIAGILITSINLIGGFVVGILQMELSAGQAMEKFTLLSVGDGLVSQIPALLVSTAAGILVTRSSSPSGLGEDVTRQILGSSRTVFATGVLLCLLVLVPGFPKAVLLTLGIFLIVISRILPKPEAPPDPKNRDSFKSTSSMEGQAPGSGVPEGPSSKKKQGDLIQKSELLSLELGLGLLPLVKGNVQSLLDRIYALRQSLSTEFGMLIPSITVRDQSNIGTHHYRLLLRGHEIAVGDVFPGQVLAMGVGNLQRPLRGRETTEPAFGLPATWIAETDRREAERLGYTVIDPLSVLITHLSETIKLYAADLLSRQDVQKLLDELKETNAAVVQEMNTLQLGIGLVHRVLQNLLREGVSISELSIIMEKLSDQFAFTKNPDELSEACRKVLVLELSKHYELYEGKINSLTIHPDLEHQIIQNVRQTPQEIALILEPDIAAHLHQELEKGIREMTKKGHTPILLCSPMVRLGLKRFFTDAFPLLKIFAYNEISPKAQLNPVYSVAPLENKVLTTA